MTENLFTGTLNKNQNKNNKLGVLNTAMCGKIIRCSFKSFERCYTVALEFIVNQSGNKYGSSFIEAGPVRNSHLPIISTGNKHLATRLAFKDAFWIA